MPAKQVRTCTAVVTRRESVRVRPLALGGALVCSVALQASRARFDPGSVHQARVVQLEEAPRPERGCLRVRIPLRVRTFMVAWSSWSARRLSRRRPRVRVPS
jgi:hypothetical protein